MGHGPPAEAPDHFHSVPAPDDVIVFEPFVALSALAELTDKGLLERRQGSGNYVRHTGEHAGVYALFRLELLDGGGLPTARILSVDHLTKDPKLPEFGHTDKGHRIRRLRYLSGKLAALEEIWLDGSYSDAIAPEELSESLYYYYRTRLGLWIARAEDRVTQGPVPDWSPAEFPYEPGKLLPLITRISWGQDGSRAEVSWTWYDPDVVHYVARLK